MVDPVTYAARAGEPDRYLAALYAPEPARSRLIALAAFGAELARIAAGGREPLLAEIRLQWWRDALATGMGGSATGHPVADRLGPDVASKLLPNGLLLGMIDAAAEPDPTGLADDQSLRAYFNKRESAAFALAARACGAGYGEPMEAAAQRAGFAYGLARALARAKPVSTPEPDGLRRAELYLQCRRSLPEAAAAIARLDTAVMGAFLPLTMAPVYLEIATGSSDATLPLRRWWSLWRAGATGRIL